MNLELVHELPRVKAWNRLNRAQKEAIVLELRDLIMTQAGEGPWPKFHIRNRQLSKPVIDEISARTRSLWKPERVTFADLIIRFPDAERATNGESPSLFPIRQAIQWAGWSVSDQEIWLKTHIRGTLVGDDKVVMELQHGK